MAIIKNTTITLLVELTEDDIKIISEAIEPYYNNLQKDYDNALDSETAYGKYNKKVEALREVIHCAQDYC